MKRWKIKMTFLCLMLEACFLLLHRLSHVKLTKESRRHRQRRGCKRKRRPQLHYYIHTIKALLLGNFIEKRKVSYIMCHSFNSLPSRQNQFLISGPKKIRHELIRIWMTFQSCLRLGSAVYTGTWCTKIDVNLPTQKSEHSIGLSPLHYVSLSKQALTQSFILLWFKKNDQPTT